MNLSPLVTDNITELLIKIIEFTQTRQKILTRNINEVRSPGFVPKDLPVDEFCLLLNTAVSEHVRTKRLALCDTANIKFGRGNDLETRSIIDEKAREILANNADEYIEVQINKLLENSLNQRIAAELLKQKQRNGFNL